MKKSFTRFSALVVAGLMMSVTAHAGVIGGDNTYNSGGAGGTGLGVGVGVGVGIGQGGNAVQGQQQGQQQGQIAIGQGGQGGKGGNATGGNASSGASATSGANGNSSFNTNSNATTSAAQGNSISITGSSPGAQTAYAPNIYPTAPCMGSTSAGGQGSFFGFTVGTSWTDTDCSLREDVRTVSQVLGDQDTAREMFCQKNAAYRAAREAKGQPCGAKKTVSAADGPQVIRAAVDTSYSGTRQDRVVNALARGEIIDDLARSRIGLPPLN